MRIEYSKPAVVIWTNEEALRNSICVILAGGGFGALNVYNKREMFRILEDEKPSLAILDAELPKVLGLEVFELIRKIERFKDTSVILISTYSEPVSGVDGQVEKRHMEELLLPAVKGLVHSKSDIENIVVSDAEAGMHEGAKKFARIIVSDIVMYNKDRVVKGIEEGNFYEVLKDEIEEGRKFYSDRVPPDILNTTNYFEEAIQRVIGVIF